MKKHILIVEDEPIAFTIGKMLFEAAGCTIAHAASGEEAIALIAQHRFDAVYMDLGLPTITGLEAGKAMHAYEKTHRQRTLPIIAVTANIDPITTQTCLNAGLIEVIAKPLTAEKVSHFLKKCDC